MKNKLRIPLIYLLLAVGVLVILAGAYPAYKIIIREIAFRKLVDQLHSPDDDLKYSAYYQLTFLNDPRVAPILISTLRDKDNDWLFRCRAATALGNIKDPHSIEPLIAALKDNDALLRYSAAEALVKIEDPRITGMLIAMLKNATSPDDHVHTVMYALEKLTGQNFGADATADCEHCGVEANPHRDQHSTF